jgi:hypothetical protein
MDRIALFALLKELENQSHLKKIYPVFGHADLMKIIG